MPVALYTVTIAREMPEQDYGPHATEDAAVMQLAKELQEAFDDGHIDGFFKITNRSIVESFDVWEAGWHNSWK